MFDTVIVRYGEIFLKSEFIRRKFERELVRNIRFRLKRSGHAYKFIRKRHRIYIKSETTEKIVDSLKKVFGITSLSPAVQTGAGIDSISETAVRLAKKIMNKGDNFAVVTSRSGRHEFSSQDVSREVGRRILDSIKDVSVNLDNPDKTILIEIKDDLAFVFDRKIDAVGGLPYGTQGTVISLLSGGIDSAVSSWMMGKRGCEIIAVNFSSGKYIEDIIEILEQYTGYKIKTFIVPYENILGKISKIAEKYTCVICKRTMYRIAGRIAEIEDAKGIVTGDNLGQVASQTLDNLKVLSSVYNPIYRPLIGMDKEEIIKIAREIGTYEFSTGGKKCRFVPRKPATRSRLDRIEEIEERIGIHELVEEAVKNARPTDTLL